MREKLRFIPVLALAIALLCATAAFAEGWTQSGNNWSYIDASGSKVYNEWKKGADGNWRWLNSNGVMATNEWIDDTFYVDENGIMAVGWKKINDEGTDYWFYFSTSGKRYEGGKKTIDNQSYYFDEYGHMGTGWVNEDKSFCDNNGHFVTGWQKLEDPESVNEDSDGENVHWYYFSSSGERYVPDSSNDYTEKRIDGERFCFNSDGQMQTGWRLMKDEADTAPISNYKYYGTNGIAYTGWKSVAPPEALSGRYDYDVCWFYFGSSGYPTADKDGVYTTSDIKTIEEKRYLFDSNGIPVHGLQKVYLTTTSTDYDTYYFGTSSQMYAQTGTLTVEEGDGTKSTFYFSNNGRGYTGIRDSSYYYKGKLQVADESLKYECVSSNKYVINTSGKLCKSKAKLKDKDENIWVTNNKGVATSYNGSSSYIPYRAPEEPIFE